jgi:hypothetical protein
MQVYTVRWLVLKLQEAVRAFSYAWPVFFRLTAFKRLDRLPQVFVCFQRYDGVLMSVHRI